jgi:hypothetical protein
MAVAVTVTDETDTTYADGTSIPEAIEYNPDAKQPLKKLWFPFRAMSAMMVVVAAVAVGTTVLLKKRNKETMRPLLTERETLGIKEAIERVVGSDNLVDRTGPYRKALNWTIYQDPTEPVPEDSNFVQRYIAAYFFFATSTERDWKYCTPPKDDERNDCSSFSATGGDGEYEVENRGGRWLSELCECDWFGVYCDAQKLIYKIHIGTFMKVLPSHLIPLF